MRQDAAGGAGEKGHIQGGAGQGHPQQDGPEPHGNRQDRLDKAARGYTDAPHGRGHGLL